MKNLTKSLAVLLFTVMMLAMVVCVPVSALSATDMADYSEEHWAAEALSWTVENDLIKGYHDNTLRPDAYLTRAEMATIINRAFGATILTNIGKYEDVGVDDWYYEEMAKAVNMGTFNGSDETHLMPEKNILREEAFAVIARALVLDGTDAKVLEKFGDNKDVSAWATGLLADLAAHEYINGSPVEGQEKNNLYPRNNITRAEFAQLLYNIFEDVIGDGIVKNLKANDSILANHNKGKLVIKDVTVDGDLVIADGVGFNSVSLENVKITGRLVIRGGKSVKLTNVTTGEGVVVSNINSVVNFQNYEDEAVFKNIIAKTPVTFLERVTGGISWGGSVSTRVNYSVEYYTEDIASDEYSLFDTVPYNDREGKNLTVEHLVKDLEGFTFNDEKTVDSFTIASGLVVKIYYTRNSYDVTLNYGYEGKDDDVVNVEYGATVDFPELEDFARDGYAFKGWFTQPEGQGDKYEDDTAFEDVAVETLYAHWVAGEVNYYVYTYKENLAGDGYDFTRKVESAVVDTPVSVTPEEIEGFTFDESNAENVLSIEKVSSNASLKVYYTRNSYTVTFNYEYDKLTPSTTNVKYGATITFPNPETFKRDGYVFNGWFTQPNAAGEKIDESYTYTDTADKQLYAHWTAGQANYTVEIYKEKLNGGYEVSTDTEIGDVDATVSVTPAAMEGFTFDEANTENVLSAVVKADHSTVLKVYYARNTYVVTFNYEIPGKAPTTDDVKYEGKITFPDLDSFTYEGHRFLGWFTEPNGAGEKISTEYVYTDLTDKQLYAHWEELPAGTASYGIEIYKQDVNGDYQLDSFTTEDATIGEEVSVTPETIEHFTFDVQNGNNVLQATVAEDGSTTLKVYYLRNMYTVTFEDPDGEGIVEEYAVYYEGTVSDNMFVWVYYPVYEVEYIGELFTSDVRNEKWVLSTDTTVDFTSDTKVVGDITVWPMWYEIIVGGYIERFDFSQSLGQVYYNTETRAIDTFKDFIFAKENAIHTAINEKNLDGKVIGKLDIILDDDRNIKLYEHEICIVETLGTESVEDKIFDALESDGLTAEEQVVEDVVHELLTDKHVTVTDDNVNIIESYGKKVDELTYDDIKDDIPESYTKIMTEKEMKDAFEEAKAQYSAEVYLTLMQYHITHPTSDVPGWLQDWYDNYVANGGEPLAMLSATEHKITSKVKIKINLVSSIIIPKYNQAKDKLEEKFYDKYSDNQYFMRLLEIIDPAYLLDGDNSLQDNDAMLSGYTLKDNEFYYDVIKETAVMADEAGKWFREKLSDDEIEELGDKFTEIMMDYMNTINEYLDKYAEKAIDKIVDKVEKLEKIKEYEDRRLTAEDIEKAEDIIKKAVKGYDTTTHAAYEKAYNFDHDRINGFKFDSNNIPEALDGSNVIDGFYEEYKGNEGWFARAEYISGK